MLLDGKVALVSGTGPNIGAEIARAAATRFRMSRKTRDIIELLVAEHQHGMPVPALHQRLKAQLVELLRKVDRGDRRADGAVERLYVE